MTTKPDPILAPQGKPYIGLGRSACERALARQAKKNATSGALSLQFRLTQAITKPSEATIKANKKQASNFMRALHEATKMTKPKHPNQILADKRKQHRLEEKRRYWLGQRIGQCKCA